MVSLAREPTIYCSTANKAQYKQLPKSGTTQLFVLNYQGITTIYCIVASFVDELLNSIGKTQQTDGPPRYTLWRMSLKAFYWIGDWTIVLKWVDINTTLIFQRIYLLRSANHNYVSLFQLFHFPPNRLVLQPDRLSVWKATAMSTLGPPPSDRGLCFFTLSLRGHLSWFSCQWTVGWLWSGTKELRNGPQ